MIEPRESKLNDKETTFDGNRTVRMASEDLKAELDRMCNREDSYFTSPPTVSQRSPSPRTQAIIFNTRRSNLIQRRHTLERQLPNNSIAHKAKQPRPTSTMDTTRSGR